ncbi:MAG: AMMECR1 family protein [Armatimonadetes bacterium]|nr:AMMECR1 family protein [Armatimonadota bacterium]
MSRCIVVALILWLFLPSFAAWPLSPRQLDLFRLPSIQKQTLDLAEKALIAWTKTGKPYVPSQKEIEGDVFHAQSGVFVTLEKKGKLVGCRGTLSPARPYLYQEIVESALAAASRDPRFQPLRSSDLPGIRMIVTIVGEAMNLSDFSGHDPLIFGLCARSGDKAGVMLPGEAPSTDKQMAWCRKRAGIIAEPVTWIRFTGIRFSRILKERDLS